MSVSCGKSVQFPKYAISQIVTDIIKTVLYIRGQVPLPLEQMKDIVKDIKKESCNGFQVFGDVKVYCDKENDIENKIDKGSTFKQGTFPVQPKHILLDAVVKFDEYFEDLQALIQTDKVLEVVLSLGSSILPREVYHIKLPHKCENKCCTKFSLEKCKQQVLKELFQHNGIIGTMPSEKVLPINVMLLLSPGTELTGNMEYKMRYKVPKTSKQLVMHLHSFCCHDSKSENSLENFQDTSEASAVLMNVPSSDMPKLWVRLKKEIKGLPNKAVTMHI